MRGLSSAPGLAYGAAMPRPTLLRTLPIAAALALAALAAHPASAGGGGGGFGGLHSNAPVSYSADDMQLLDRENRLALNGSVDITQDDLHVAAARVVAAYSNDAAGLKIHRLDATGGVTVTRGQDHAAGDVAVYDVDQRIITMVGNVTLHRGADVLRGGRLVIDLDSGQARIDGRGTGGPVTPGGQGRVSGSFVVPKKGG